ncbi:hypothetical protein ROLI_030210 [Roseobacter fucihabitans]|uniref:Uncharacterized protein n=1 Tax=Roseobacter fucihabitans TaxID=1537242 RepID=A0ABZ2BVU7_9RHOB|nr:hypothetical protein [Roseobacter litoralis]MBC6967903.1 hypothetical protein [Roseobacter litoralis]MBC6968079.1 hypothetical protein [Roseobacter litoralis]
MEKSDVIITVAVVLAPAVIAFVWVMWENSVLPAMIPKSEIVAEADELIEKYGSRAEEVAANREYEAWYRSELTDQGRWKRVRREIARQQRRD